MTNRMTPRFTLSRLMYGSLEKQGFIISTMMSPAATKQLMSKYRFCVKIPNSTRYATARMTRNISTKMLFFNDFVIKFSPAFIVDDSGLPVKYYYWQKRHGKVLLETDWFSLFSRTASFFLFFYIRYRMNMEKWFYMIILLI